MWSSIGFHSRMFSAKFCWSEGKREMEIWKVKDRHTADNRQSSLELSVHVCAGFFFKIRFNFLARKLKWAFLIVCLSVSLSLCNFIFYSSTTGPISTQLSTNHLWAKGIQVYSNEGPRYFQRGNNLDILVRINWQLLKILFSRTIHSQSQPNFAHNIPMWRELKFV